MHKLFPTILLAFLFVLALATQVPAGAPAARMGDITSHGWPIALGSPNVLIGGQPAARQGDPVACPLGGHILQGSSTVLINGQPAARVGDPVQESMWVGPYPVPVLGTIVLGLPTVLIGP